MGSTITAHREAGNVLHTYVQLNRSTTWVADIDFTDNVAAAARVAAEFEGWAPELTALITEGETAPIPRPIYAVPSGSSNSSPALLTRRTADATVFDR